MQTWHRSSCSSPTGKGMTSLNAHDGPVDFLVATYSTLSPDLLKRDSLVEGMDSGIGGEDKERSHSSQESLKEQQQEDCSAQREAKPKGVLLQYRLRSTSQLPGKVLTARPDEATDSSQESLEHTLEDGSVYELSDDPEVWVRGPGPSTKEGPRRERVMSAAVMSGGRGFRRLTVAGSSTSASSSSNENTLMVWQLPLTVWNSDQKQTQRCWLVPCEMEDWRNTEGQINWMPLFVGLKLCYKILMAPFMGIAVRLYCYAYKQWNIGNSIKCHAIVPARQIEPVYRWKKNAHCLKMSEMMCPSCMKPFF